jgi:serine/threonine-protein kinase
MQEQARWLIANRYEVGEVVGRGGYGMVCRGFDRVAGRTVALKMLSPEAGRDPDVVERMLREQQALVALSGTCAVTAIDLCRLESGAPCLIMEWLDGRDLEQELSEREGRGELGSVEQLLRSLEPLTQTLGRAHELGLVHRDIKPANIFVTSGPEPGTRLLDFGLSRMKSAAPLTQLGMVMGSPSYIAPETWRGNSSALDGRADLFSLAVIVFRWLTGKLPFDAPDLLGKMNAVTTGPRPSVVALRPELSPALDAWMARALAVEPDARFQTAQDFFLAFTAAASGVEPPADASGTRPRVQTEQTTPLPIQGALATAWRTAASLLKRFTGARDSPVPAEPSASTVRPLEPRTPSAAPPPAGAPSRPPSVSPPPIASAPPESSERPSVWLDSSELEDATESVRLPLPEVGDAEPATPAEPQSEPKKSKGKKTGKRKGAAKQTSVAQPNEPKAKASGKKSRGKKRKAKKR